jgi:hypothetical protein
MKKSKVGNIGEFHVGKKMIVRANVAGVHAGIVEAYGSVSDVAANGLKPNGGHSIGAMLKSVTITNPQGLELAEMTDEAYKSIENWEN